MAAPRKPPARRRSNPAVNVATDKVNVTNGAPGSDGMMWVRNAGAVAGLVAVLFGLMAYATGGFDRIRSGGAQEAALAARVVAIERVEPRVEILSSRLSAIENTVSTATRVRDQAAQGVVDRLRGLEASDTAYSDRVVALANTLATISARIEDILRRQEGLERRLDRSGWTPPAERGSGEAPALWRKLGSAPA